MRSFTGSLKSLNSHAAQGTRVTSGAFTFASGLGEIHVAGQSGFQMDVHVDITSGIYNQSQCAELDCQPGTEVRLFAHWVGQVVRSDSRPSMLVGL
jgi:hypothetical protein